MYKANWEREVTLVFCFLCSENGRKNETNKDEFAIS